MNTFSFVIRINHYSLIIFKVCSKVLPDVRVQKEGSNLSVWKAEAKSDLEVGD